MSREELTVVGTYGHGGIKLTAYMPSQRVGVEVTAANAVMDWSELFEFVDKIRKPNLDDATVERAAEALYDATWDADGATLEEAPATLQDHFRTVARFVLAAAVEAGQ